MSKVNFKQIKVEDIEGNIVSVDVHKSLGNALYMQGENIEECELGKKIYHSEGEVEITAKDADVIKRFAGNFSFVVREALKKAVSVFIKK